MSNIILIVLLILLILVSVFIFGNWQFEQGFLRDVQSAFLQAKGTPGTITETDLEHLPLPVRRYLTYVGVAGKPKVQHYYVRFEGQMRNRGGNWFPFSSRQYNFTGEPTRLFFMKARMFGITVPGYHKYVAGSAGMHIKLFGLIPMVNISPSSGVLDKAETVTLLNDMCLLAPGSLINANIQWQENGPLSAIARFTVGQHTIRAELIFNEAGELINFISDDRLAVADKKQYRFSTPVKDYRDFGGYKLPSYGEAIWHYPDGPFVYGQFNTKEIIWNPER